MVDERIIYGQEIWKLGKKLMQAMMNYIENDRCGEHYCNLSSQL